MPDAAVARVPALPTEVLYNILNNMLYYIVYTPLLYSIENHMICIKLFTTFQRYIDKKCYVTSTYHGRETGKMALSHVI